MYVKEWKALMKMALITCFFNLCTGHFRSGEELLSRSERRNSKRSFGTTKSKNHLFPMVQCE